MKTLVHTFLILLISGSLYAQRTVDHVGIITGPIDVTTKTTVGELTINPTVAGKVIVRFDGTCHASVGDLIVLAASNTTDWHVNDGNVGIEVVDTDFNSRTFAHTRVYDVTPGSHTFYAVAHNYVETDGTGTATIYGSLTVEFIPETAGIVAHEGILTTNADLSTLTTLASQTIEPTVDGKVIVRFDGSCVASVGDRIILAASNSPSWSSNDGNVGIEILDADVNASCFSHTRVYNVSAGSHTYYAVAQNYVETDGTGFASIYGSLTVQFIPSTEGIVAFEGIATSNPDVSAVTAFGELTIAPAVAGKAMVSFDGSCYATPGDRIILAASNSMNWLPNDGNVGVEVYDNDLNHESFSHTRVYDVAAGVHTFYGLAQNYVEYDGDGSASIYGSLTVNFIPEPSASGINGATAVPFVAYPNPTAGEVRLEIGSANERHTLHIFNANGALVASEQLTGSSAFNVELPTVKGIYLLQLMNENGASSTVKVIRQ